jgi:hypothetical protein
MSESKTRPRPRLPLVPVRGGTENARAAKAPARATAAAVSERKATSLGAALAAVSARPAVVVKKPVARKGGRPPPPRRASSAAAAPTGSAAAAAAAAAPARVTVVTCPAARKASVRRTAAAAAAPARGNPAATAQHKVRENKRDSLDDDKDGGLTRRRGPVRDAERCAAVLSALQTMVSAERWIPTPLQHLIVEYLKRTPPPPPFFPSIDALCGLLRLWTVAEGHVPLPLWDGHVGGLLVSGPYLFLSERKSGYVFVFDIAASFELVAELGSRPVVTEDGALVQAAGAMLSPAGMAVVARRWLLVADRVLNCIHVIDMADQDPGRWTFCPGL